MRHQAGRGVGATLLAGLLVGCGGGHSSNSATSSEVSITNEELQLAGGDANLCAVKGTATNGGSRTLRVTVNYEALDPSDHVVGASTASFEVSGFSTFAFSQERVNSDGQPSSSIFSNGLPCRSVWNFRRVGIHVTTA
jgi:hypothetical protein